MMVLKVKPDVLKKQANEIRTDANSLEKELKEITEVIVKTKRYWEGDASEKHQKNYKKFEEDIPRLIKRLKEHPVDLLKMAKLYDETEVKNKQMALKLPSDVIT